MRWSGRCCHTGRSDLTRAGIGPALDASTEMAKTEMAKPAGRLIDFTICLPFSAPHGFLLRRRVAFRADVWQFFKISEPVRFGKSCQYPESRFAFRFERGFDGTIRWSLPSERP